MKKFAARALSVCALACAFAGCSDSTDDEGGIELVVPSVKIESGAVEGNTLTFTVTPVNAASCAYVCYAEGSAKQDAAAILASGKAVDAAKPSEVTVSDLEYHTTYCVAAAVKSATGDVAMTETTLTTGAERAKELGAPANTYIVSEAGTYEFSAKRISGEPIGGIVTADWLWATKNAEDETEQKLVGDVSYADGKIRFSATGARGNVAIAAFDAQKNVVWEWLIWCTERPDEMPFSSGAVFQDRAVGATGSEPADGVKAQSLIVYQWGRLTPLVSGYVDEDENSLFSEARKWTIMNPEYDFLSWGAENRQVTIENAIAAPTTMFAGKDIYDWLIGRNPEEITNDMFLWAVDKTDYDPCPAGYRLPVPADWGDFAEKVDRSRGEAEEGVYYTYAGRTAWFPSTVERHYDSGEAVKGFAHLFLWNGVYSFLDGMGLVAAGIMTEEQAISMGIGGYYASRVSVQFNPESLAPSVDVTGNWGFAQSVRCVKIQ